MDDRPNSSVSLDWHGGFKFESSDSHGHTLTLDAPESEDTPFGGFMPGDMLLTALAGCSGIDVVNILTKQRQQVDSLQINVRGHQNPEPPWAWEDVEIRYILRGKELNRQLIERAIDLSENRYCSIGATIGGVTRISSSFEIVDSQTK